MVYVGSALWAVPFRLHISFIVIVKKKKKIIRAALTIVLADQKTVIQNLFVMTSGRGTRLENGSDESLLQAMLTNIFYSADVSFGNTPAPEPARKTEKEKKNPYSILITLELISIQALIQETQSLKKHCSILTAQIDGSNLEENIFCIQILKKVLIEQSSMPILTWCTTLCSCPCWSACVRTYWCPNAWSMFRCPCL